MMRLDDALAELRRSDNESRLESDEVRATIVNAVISGQLIPATALAEAQAEIARLRAALREIIDASNNTGIEMGTVGMRVAERVEDIACAALSPVAPDQGEG